MKPDTINACFELGGALLIWLNVRRLWRDRSVRGVFAPVFVFYTAWGFWNCIFYPTVGQYLSFYAGLGTTFGNLAWVCLARHFHRREQRRKYLRDCATPGCGGMCRKPFVKCVKCILRNSPLVGGVS